MLTLRHEQQSTAHLTSTRWHFDYTKSASGPVFVTGLKAAASGFAAHFIMACVVVVQPSAAQECDYQQFLQELEQLLAKAEVLNGNS